MTGDFDLGPLADVHSRREDGQWQLFFTIDLPHPPPAVWAALTEPAQVGGWAPFTVDRSLAVTGEVTLSMIDGEVATDIPATVLTADAPVLLEYTWGPDRLRWHLTPAGNGTRLVLRHTMADRDQLAGIAAGWHLCLLVARRLLDGRPIPPIRGRDALHHGWAELKDDYAGKLVD